MADRKTKDKSKRLLEIKHKKMLIESEEHARIFASYQYAISELRKFYIAETSFNKMLQKTVNLLVKSFGYYMAWYGELKAEEKVIIPKVWAGKYEKYLDGLQLELDDSKDAKCAMSLAILRKKPFGYADLEHDKDFEKWRPLALKYGYRSNQAIPLIIEGKCIGAFLIYSIRPRAFSKTLIQYLMGISNELAMIVEKTTERNKAEEELRNYREHLEEMVEERAAELKTINEQLKKDITERKKTAEKIKQAAEEWDRTFNAIADLMFILDRNYTILRINKAFANALKLKPEQIIGKKCHELLHKSDKPWPECPFGKTKSDNKAHAVEIYDPNIGIPLLVTTSPIFDSEGKLEGCVHIAKDITEQKKAEKEIKESELKFKTMFENAGGAIFIADTQTGKILDCNLLAEKLMGRPRSEIIGMHQSKLHPKGEAEKYKEKFAQHIQKGHLVDYEGEAQYKDGRKIPVLIKAQTMKIADKDVIVGLFVEITERKKAEEKLKRAYKELKESQEGLIQAEKLAAIGQLATGMAHGINNPLSVISGEAEMLFKDSSKDKDTRDSSKIITEQARRIKSITEGLLGFSHKEKFVQRQLDVNNIIEKSLSLLSYQVKSTNIKIIKELEPNLPKILGSGNQLQEVFLCIMLNAIQAIEGRGKLTVRSRYEKKAVVIEFKDTGEGMNKETLKKIFNPFFSTREKGTGLGLSIVDRIIKAHKGIIEAHSKLGEGSTFIIKLAALKEGGK